MSDPRDIYRKDPSDSRVVPTNRGMPWVWIAGAVAVVLLIMIFAFGTGNDQTANAPERGTQTETTGAAPGAPAPPAGQTSEKPAPQQAPAAKPETTTPQQ